MTCKCGEEGRAPRPFIGSEGGAGWLDGKGIGRPVVAASMSVIHFGGEGKQRGECGVKRGGVQCHLWERRGRRGGAHSC
jgi:hypothetical protein